MRLLRYSFVLFPLVVLSACMHGKKAAGFQAPVATRTDTTSMLVELEEEVFIKGCVQNSLGNDKQALSYFMQALKFDSKCSAADYEVARIYARTGDRERALSFARSAVTYSPGNEWFVFLYGDLLQQKGENEQAVELYKNLCDKEPGRTDLLFRYAAALQKAGKNEDALKAYDRIESIEGISDTLTNCRIAVYRLNNDAAGEEQALQKLVAAFPEENNFLRLASFYQKSDPAKSAAIYTTMTTQFPFAAIPHLRLAEYERAQKQDKKAFAEAEAGFEIPGDAAEKIRLLNSWYPVSDSAPALSLTAIKEADSLCRVLRRVHASDAAAFAVSGDYLLKEGKRKEARDMYRASVATDRNSYATWKHILELDLVLDDSTAQEKDCKTVADLFPSLPDAYYYLGMFYYNKKEYKKAEQNFEPANDFTIDNPGRSLEIMKLLAKSELSAGDDEKADDLCEKIFASDSTDTALMQRYCSSLIRRKTRTGTAEKLMTKVLSLKPNDATANEQMGDIEFLLGKTDDAVNYWKKAKALGGGSPELDKKISSRSMEDGQ